MSTYLGSAIADGSAGNGSTSVTVPSGATYAHVTLSFYDAGSGYPATITLDGQSGTNVIQVDQTGGANGHYMGYVTGFTTGSKTFAWTWTSNEAISEGGAFYITFWSDVDTSTPIEDSDAQSTAGSTTCQASVTGTIGNSCVTHVETYTGYGDPWGEMSTNGSPTITSVYDNDSQNSQVTDIDYFTTTAGTHTIDIDNESYSSILAAILSPAAGGASPFYVPSIVQNFRNMNA